MSTLTTLIYLKSRINTKGENPIYLRVTVDGKRRETSLKRGINYKKWDKSKQKVKGNSEEARVLNKYLRSVEVNIDRIEHELNDSGKGITIETVMNRYLGVDKKNHMLMDVIIDFNTRKKNLVTKSTFKHYIASLNHVKNFLKHQYKLSDIDIKEIDYQCVLDYDYYLRHNKNISNNKTIRYVKTLGAIFLSAINRGWVNKDPFANYKKRKTVENVKVLSKLEIDTIYNADMDDICQERVRDVFIFCCYTALAYCDAEQLRKQHIVLNVDGNRWIKITRRKSRIVSDIPIFPVAEEILKKYENDPLVIHSGKLLPMYSNQKMNRTLKEISKLSGINKNLHFHMARHTFGTTLGAANRMPIETIMRIMGHKSITMARHYVKISTAVMLEDVNNLRNILSGANKTANDDKNSAAV